MHAVHENMSPHSRTWLLCKKNQNPFQEKHGCFATNINTHLPTRSAERTPSAAPPGLLTSYAQRRRAGLPSAWRRGRPRLSGAHRRDALRSGARAAPGHRARARPGSTDVEQVLCMATIECQGGSSHAQVCVVFKAQRRGWRLATAAAQARGALGAPGRRARLARRTRQRRRAC